MLPRGSARERTLVWALTAAYIGTIFAANWFIGHVGTQFTPDGPHTIQVWPGIYAPSGVIWVGVALVLRDVIQQLRGRAWSVGAMLVGAAVSYLVAPNLALASAVAFLLSETADLFVYTPLIRSGRIIWAMTASSTVGLVVDSIVFLALAFGSLEFIEGQIIGKIWGAIFATACVWLIRRRYPRALVAQPT